jgi:serine/threonine protein kinase
MNGNSPEQRLPPAITRSTANHGSPLLQHSIAPPPIPDLELLKRIGGGSYGEVWLARNVFGQFRAVKIVFRSAFESDRPFEREFEGVRRFEPISRTHDSQVDILHVGRAIDGSYFYYVMELADPTEGGEAQSSAPKISSAPDGSKPTSASTPPHGKSAFEVDHSRLAGFREI